MRGADFRSDIAQRLQKWRQRLLWQRALNCFALVVIIFALFRLFGIFELKHGAIYFCTALGGMTIIMFAALLNSSKWRALTPDNFALHLNRRFDDFEESAQLLLREDGDLGVLQQLQKQRCINVYSENIARLAAWQPPIRYRNVLAISLLAACLAWFAPHLRALSTQVAESRALAKENIMQSSAGDASLQGIEITLTPPRYTQLSQSTETTMDLEVFEGSLIEWQLDIDGPADTYAIEWSNGEQIPLQKVDGSWQASTTAHSTDLYKLTAIQSGATSYIGDVYALTVQLDQAPDIKILEPTVTTLEIPKSGPATFASEVLVADDFGIHSVDILASVAKGSGEGVKFRDQTLSFDRSESTDKGQLYLRHWDLNDLDMEPGDEIYFSVVATDNKQPEANISRSTTLIIRWLEDDVAGLAADGLAIDFIPEFFKSQRQIIIDTEQLLEDQPNLESKDFKNTSYEIGQAQADLKQKYGQFLGDEFGEGPGEQFAPTADADEHDGDHEEGHDDDHGHDGEADHAEARTNPAGAHGHAHIESGVTINNATNMTDIVKLFGHDHGAPEVGKVNKQSPIALMKRAVSEMWSAERHLMQAEPDLALPFEYEAYKYLKLARQADRIYVKRLGFEPPPVSEEARLTGELKDIRSYSLQQHASPEDLPPSRVEQRLLRQVWQLLGIMRPEGQIEPSQDEVLSRMSAQYKVLAQQRPALIKQAATIEKLRAAGHWQLNNCETCIDELKQSIWNLMDDGDALLMHPQPIYSNDDNLIRDYQLEMQSLSDSQSSGLNNGGQQP